MANVLPREKRLAVLGALVDGASIRATERMTGVHRDTIMRFALSVGEGADRLHNRLVRDLSCSLVDVDEQWSFVGKKGFRVTEDDAPGIGEAWSWVAIDRTSRLAISYHVGRRDQENADRFVSDLRARLVVMPKLMTSDGLAHYTSAIKTSFGPAAPYAQTIKNYSRGPRKTPDHRYEPPRMGEGSFITKKAVLGAPDLAIASTSKVEVNNLFARHKNGRMRRLCLAFSKTLKGHRAAVSLCYVHFNFCHVLRTTRTTPALAAGVTDHLWELDEFLDAVLSEAPCACPEKMPLTIPKPEGPAHEDPRRPVPRPHQHRSRPSLLPRCNPRCASMRPAKATSSRGRLRSVNPCSLICFRARPQVMHFEMQSAVNAGPPQDERGTPWLVRRIADGAEGGTHGTLRAARASIAAGHADIAARVDAAGRRAASAARVAGASWDEVERARDAAEMMEWSEIRAERAAA